MYLTFIRPTRKKVQSGIELVCPVNYKNATNVFLYIFCNNLYFILQVRKNTRSNYLQLELLIHCRQKSFSSPYLQNYVVEIEHLILSNLLAALV